MQQLPPHGHDPVLLEPVLQLLDPRPSQAFLDCTLGRAGHALAIANRVGAGGLLVGIDADPKNLEYAKARLSNAPCQIRLFHANFAELGDVMAALALAGVDGIIADLGLSTNQLFDPRY